VGGPPAKSESPQIFLGILNERPTDRFAHERSHLIATAGQPGFRLEASQPRRVADDYLVSFEANRYSVPFTLIGQCAPQARSRNPKGHSPGQRYPLSLGTAA